MVYENAATAGYSASVTLLLYYQGTIYQENASSDWWSWTSGAWVAVSGDPRGQAASTSGFGIKVSGNKLVSSVDGSVVQLRGANVSGLEEFYTTASSAWPGGGMTAEPTWSSMTAWHMNVVRLPLNEANWLRYQCNGQQPDANNLYQTAVKKAVADATAAGIYVILDLHWSAPGTTLCPTGQGSFADADHSVAFWTSVATAFKSNPAVMFELFNEAFGDNNYSNWFGSDADTMLDGGSFAEFLQQNSNTGGLTTYNMTWNVAGLQAMLNAIRATGATNVVIAGTIGWDGQIETWLQYKPVDTLSPSQLVAAWHAYGWPNSTITAQQTFADAAAILADGFPIIVTETNGLGAKGSSNVENQVLNWADSNSVGYLHWGWTPYSSTTDLTQIVSCGTSGSFQLNGSSCAKPTSSAGAYYQAGLVCAVAGTKECW